MVADTAMPTSDKMKHPRNLFLLLLLGLMLVGGGAEEDNVKRASKSVSPIRVSCIGDSITTSTCGGVEGGYQDILQKQLNPQGKFQVTVSLNIYYYNPLLRKPT